MQPIRQYILELIVKKTSQRGSRTSISYHSDNSKMKVKIDPNGVPYEIPKHGKHVSQKLFKSAAVRHDAYMKGFGKKIGKHAMGQYPREMASVNIIKSAGWVHGKKQNGNKKD